MASRHQAREARRPATADLRHEGPPRRICDTEARIEATSRRRGFSLIEVLLSVFILSIGVISITALFPAGILQQRQSVDDITGPIVAQNALAIIRTKIRAADFGTFEEFNNAQPPLFTIEGDWPWLRPAFIISDVASLYPSGTIDIFNTTGVATASEPGIDSGIPFSTARYPNGAPIFIITQQERYYPMAPLQASEIRPPKPQYVWDCMFRRFQGKVMVAIFVYRTTMAGGGDVNYSVPAQPPPNDDVPPIPISLNITTSEMWADEGPWDADGDQFIWGTRAGEPYDTADQRQSWQEPGQWILDQNNNMHRVLSQNRASLDTAVEVEMVRPVPQMPPLWVYFFPGTVADLNNDGLWDQDVVSNIWYIPREVTLGGVAVRLTPVYVTVREL